MCAATIVDVSNFGPSTDELETKLPAQPGHVDELRRRFDVIEHRISVAGRIITLLHPRSADDLIDEDDFNRDERLPYWAEIWPSAYVLAQRIARENGRSSGRPSRLLELGCGSGLAVVTALAAGFDVTAVDYYPAALEFVKVNAELNGLPPPQIRVVDWRNYPDDLRDFDVVIAADVLYETGYCRLIAEAFRQSLVRRWNWTAHRPAALESRRAAGRMPQSRLADFAAASIRPAFRSRRRSGGEANG